MTKRTDSHRPGAIIPANYSYMLSYNLATTYQGWPIPSTNIEAVLALPREKFVKTGGLGKCSICGANYVYGDIWVHEPTGEYLHVGHDCAAKYEMLADRSAFELEMGRLKAAAAVQVERKRKQEDRERFLAKHPGLAEALTVNHSIVRDIASRFQQYTTLSDKQVALVFKIATEMSKPAEEKERTTAAPVGEGRKSFEGVVVSAKTQDTNYGTQYKMTVKVTTPDGAVWLAWGTIPTALLDSVPSCTTGGRLQNLRGATVKVTAGLKPGRDAHFALMVRPVGSIVKLAPEVATAAEALKF